jgi:hypothetical protein
MSCLQSVDALLQRVAPNTSGDSMTAHSTALRVTAIISIIPLTGPGLPSSAWLWFCGGIAASSAAVPTDCAVSVHPHCTSSGL